jgi:hypothetical protein
MHRGSVHAVSREESRGEEESIVEEERQKRRRGREMKYGKHV